MQSLPMMALPAWLPLPAEMPTWLWSVPMTQSSADDTVEQNANDLNLDKEKGNAAQIPRQVPRRSTGSQTQAAAFERQQKLAEIAQLSNEAAVSERQQLLAEIAQLKANNEKMMQEMDRLERTTELQALMNNEDARFEH